MGGGLESRCVGLVYGADGTQHHPHRTHDLCILSSTCFGYVRLSSGALDVELQHMVFCTEFLDGWWS